MKHRFGRKIHVIRIAGKIDGKSAVDEQTVEVVGGSVCETEVELAETERLC